MLFNILALLSLLLTVMLLRKIVNIFPSVMACLMRWKENINIDSSVKLRRDRNYIAMAMIIPFCLSCFLFGVYSPRFIISMNSDAGLAATVGIFTAYIILRQLMTHLVRPRKMNKNVYHAAAVSDRTFFILLTFINLTVGGILSFFDISHDDIKNAIIWISVGIYCIFIIRKTQIFKSSCSIFTAFLYLCALEIFPTGILIASAVIL